ncbi:tyrosine--tRNA ligase [Candidatus Nomurabacteria bacterium]|nr:tyrosine--tRNA ligase [Candidatus Nomurabacteria bacterium]
MPKINTDSDKIQHFLSRGIENIYPKRDFLEKQLKSGKQLSIYYGIDPTGPSLHLGHAIELEKLRQWQELGHKIIILIGDFTATIGDPTDKNATRKPLTRQQVLKNAKDYKNQAAKFIKFTGSNKAEYRYNSKWFAKMKFAEILDLSSKFTTQQLLERDMFQKRLKEEKPISLHELMYPVMQAYDSVMLKVDGEIGGNDQTFNMLAGRTLMKQLLNQEKFVLTMKLLTDSSGLKMGKSEGNMLSFSDSANEMFGKVMSWTDGMILPGFELCTKIDDRELKEIKKELEKDTNPRDLKFRLATEIVSIYYSVKQAKQAGENFEQIFKNKKNPDQIQEFNLTNKKINPVDLLITLKFVNSKNEARRLIEGNGMKLNKEKVSSWEKDLNLKPNDIIQAGKRKFAKIK